MIIENIYAHNFYKTRMSFILRIWFKKYFYLFGVVVHHNPKLTDINICND